MSMHPMKKQKPQAQVKVNLKEAETMKCDDCNNTLFIESYVLKKISALISPTGQEGIIPIQVFACGDCGKLKDIGTGGESVNDLVGA